MPDAPDDRNSPGPQTLVIRAAFVPDGQEPPPEFSSVFDPLKFRATLDPATGTITCDNAGIAFDGDVRAEWHPDGGQGEDGGAEVDGQGGDARTTGGKQGMADGLGTGTDTDHRSEGRQARKISPTEFRED